MQFVTIALIWGWCSVDLWGKLSYVEHSSTNRTFCLHAPNFHLVVLEVGFWVVDLIIFCLMCRWCITRSGDLRIFPPLKKDDFFGHRNWVPLSSSLFRLKPSNFWQIKSDSNVLTLVLDPEISGSFKDWRSKVWGVNQHPRLLSPCQLPGDLRITGQTHSSPVTGIIHTLCSDPEISRSSSIRSSRRTFSFGDLNQFQSPSVYHPDIRGFPSFRYFILWPTFAIPRPCNL